MKTKFDLYQDGEYMSGLFDDEVARAEIQIAGSETDEIALTKAVREELRNFDDIVIEQLADNSDALSSLFNFLEVAAQDTNSQSFLLAQDRLLIDAAELITNIKLALVSFGAEDRSRGIVTTQSEPRFINPEQQMSEAGVRPCDFHQPGGLS